MLTIKGSDSLNTQKVSISVKENLGTDTVRIAIETGAGSSSILLNANLTVHQIAELRNALEEIIWSHSSGGRQYRRVAF